ncbi:hypothetical protein V8E52_004127 [Russula decolorans]
MSSAGKTTFSTSNIQLIIDASADYTRLTGKDLSKDSLVTLFKHSNSPEPILELLQRWNKAFEEHQDRNQKLMSPLGPTVRVLQSFSRTLGEAVSLVPIPPADTLFVGIDIPAAASGVTSSYDAVLDIFECLGSFLKHLEIYTTIPPSPIMTDMIIKIMIELLSVFAIATKQIQQGRFKIRD